MPKKEKKTEDRASFASQNRALARWVEPGPARLAPAADCSVRTSWQGPAWPGLSQCCALTIPDAGLCPRLRLTQCTRCKERRAKNNQMFLKSSRRKTESKKKPNFKKTARQAVRWICFCRSFSETRNAARSTYPCFFLHQARCQSLLSAAIYHLLR